MKFQELLRGLEKLNKDEITLSIADSYAKRLVECQGYLSKKEMFQLIIASKGIYAIYAPALLDRCDSDSPEYSTFTAFAELVNSVGISINTK